MAIPQHHPNMWSKAEQTRLLGEAREKVRHFGFLMKRSVDANNLQEALKHATLMVAELRTGYLTPKVYYELYMEVFDGLGFLELYFMTLHRAGVPLARVYEAVQLTGNVLPRLYLMITAGSVYIRSMAGKAKDVLADLSEMVKGVQHPQRGLFLRHYLAQKCKDKLPDVGSPYEGAGGSIGDAIGFCIANFGEMNRLWVRLQHMGGNKGRKRRERERLELRLLVGGQLSRLSMLSGLDAATYASSVLPRLLEEVRACRDRIAQPYLYECILQAFPIDFTHATLQQLLEALPRLVPDPAVAKACVASLLTRLREEAVTATAALHEAAGNGDEAAKALLAGRAEDGRLAGLQATPTSLAAAAAAAAGSAAGAAATPSPLAGLDIFGMLLAAVDALVREPAGPFRAPRGGERESGGDAGTGEGFPGGTAAGAAAPAAAGAAQAAPAPPECVAALLEVYASLASFALACYPGHLPHVDAVLGSTADSLREALAPGSAGAATGAAGRGATGNEASTAAANSKGGSAAGRSALSRLTGGSAAAAAPAEAEEGAEGKEGGARARGFGRGAAGLSSLSLDDDCSRLVVSLLGQVQGALGLSVLSLEHYAGLMAPLRFPYRRSIAGKLLDAVLAAGQRVAAPDTARRLCATLSPLLRDEEGSGGEGDEASEQFAGEQARVAKLVLLFGATTDRGFNAAVEQAAAPPSAPPADAAEGAKAAAGEEEEGEKAPLEAAAAGPLSLPLTPETDTDAHFSVLAVAQEALSHGGSRRIGATLPPLVFSTLQLLRRVAVRERIAAANPSAAPLRFGYRRIFEFLLELVRGLASSHTELALRLTLQCALAAEAGDIAEEFTSTAFIAYEEITDSRTQVRALTQIIAALQAVGALEVEAYETFVQRATLNSIKLLRKPDQVRCVLLCARLFWRGPLPGVEAYQRPKELVQCLQKALNIADKCMPSQPALFVAIFDAYTYHFEKGVPSVLAAHLSDLISLTRDQVETMRAGSERDEAVVHLRNIVGHIAKAKEGGGDGAALYADVMLPA